MKILVTGGAGFIGSALIRHFITHTRYHILNVDKLTYAGSKTNLSTIENDARYHFFCGDICDFASMEKLVRWFEPNVILNLAAESHVDRSIANPGEFIQTNIAGTANLLMIAKSYWQTLPQNLRETFRFVQVSTDEVFGDAADYGEASTESSAYRPSSPYSASKASADHMVNAWHRTYSLPTIITRCTNNYGPFQHPEKLIPLCIHNAIIGQSIPVYGNGAQRRNWLYVEDHVRALECVIERGKPGESYNISGDTELSNIELVKLICTTLEQIKPCQIDGLSNYQDLITHVEDRPGHDHQYLVDSTKTRTSLNWQPTEVFSTGIAKTLNWCIKNMNYHQ